MATITENLQTIKNSLTSIKNALIDKGVEVTGDITTYGEKISEIQTGSVSTAENDVNFYDYDGTILYSYSASDFVKLSEMPALPTQDGLICQGWNWSLEDAQTYVSKYGKNNIGAMYITDDGATRLYVKIEDYLRREIPLYFTQNIANGVEVNWGDGSATETFSDTIVNTTHTFTNVGEYMISLLPSESCTLKLVGHPLGQNSPVKTCSMLQNLRIGYNTQLETGAFKNSYMLKTVTIPQYITNISHSAFQYCINLEYIVFPNSITTISNYSIQYCYKLKKMIFGSSSITFGSTCFSTCYLLDNIYLRITSDIGRSCFEYDYMLKTIIITDTTQSIGQEAFKCCNMLSNIYIPSSVNNLDNNVFYNCSSLLKVDFSTHTTIPTIGTNCFYKVPTDCKIVVPDALYDEWIATTNWANYASYIIKKSDYDAL